MAPKVLTEKQMFFKIAKYLGYFCMNIFHLNEK